MRSLSLASGAAATLLSGLVSAAATGAVPRSNNPPHYIATESRANSVREAFLVSWEGYEEYALPHDTLKPVSDEFEDDRNGWGASAVDALSTALVMREWDVVVSIIDHVESIDFSTTKTEVSLFETTIRYLGGLLSAYDLLDGPLADELPSNYSSSVPDILKQAQRLADNLKFAFDTPSGIPDNSLFFDPPRRGGSETNGLATIGTLVLEWTRLSDITGDNTYAELAQKAEGYLLDPQPKDIAEPFPGLLGGNVRIDNGTFTDGNGGWGGGTDSFYEYLIKMYLYDKDRFGDYRDRWIAAVDSSIENLASHPTSNPDLTFLAEWRGKTLQFSSQHLACFHGGNFILGGLTLDEPKYVEFGLRLVDACRVTYAETLTGIGPEVFGWQDNKLPPDAENNPPAPDGQAAFYEASGFWIKSANYVLRPEVIESYYYAYRATGDVKYQDWAWEAFENINKTCRAGSGYSSVKNVNEKDGGGFDDFQESFWFAEVLKYSFLIHNPDEPWQVKADHTNEFVFNTEAHPIRIFGGQETRVG
ncbi:glycoside hydrolase [Dichotomopilus funicola]|uniref:alpha-1,2-Mannosidase n=1 Tax=Dichotomopilus funicola TaxID=1934379 RepID=A0AAN6VA51_9PEZI|nr:glycoside hydrolase [Dichotomopilus funicola]